MRKLGTCCKGNRNTTIDLIKVIMAILIVALHTTPFDGNPIISYLVCQVLSRLGVPFFAVVSGYYYFQKLNSSNGQYLFTLKRFLKKFLPKYLLLTSLYLMLKILLAFISGNGFKYSVLAIFQIYFIDGIFHLWYMLAIVYSVIIVSLIYRYSKKTLYISSVVMLFFGILIYGYGGLFNSGFINTVVQRTMPLQFLTLVYPFFVIGGFIFEKIDYIGKNIIFYTLLSLLVYIIEIFILKKFDIMENTTLCLFAVPTVCCIFLSAIRFPNILENDKAGGGYFLSIICQMCLRSYTIII